MAEMEIEETHESFPTSPMPQNFMLWREVELHEFPDKFIFRSAEAPDQGFSIARSDGSFEKVLTDDSCSGNPSKVSTIYGVAGTIWLLAGMYVLVITSRKAVGTYVGYPVYRKRDESYFLTLLKIVESTPELYYSYETDITLNLQRRYKLAEGWMSKPMWKQADPRFVWNRNILEELIENKLDQFILPLLQGSFQAGQLKLNKSPATITLISRRCTRRLGTRMWRRGANLEGDAANFIETEQLLEYQGFKSSFLQPKVVERHFRDLLQRYGEIVALDLTDQHGDEGVINMAFAAEMRKLQDARYVSFDFHQHCGNSNFDNLQFLYDQISEDFEKQGYFLLNAEREIFAEQSGIIRSNCIDCLDRTNVTQSYLGQISLNSQLQRVGALSATESISTFLEDFEVYKNLWVEQGDKISLEYSGTHALKGDLVRYGKQTMAGILKDGMSAISRYYLNNFQDGDRQDAIDLISGHFTVNKSSPSPFQLNRFETFTYLPVASALLIGGLTVTSITFNQAGQRAQSFLSSVICAGATAGMMALVKANGRQICSRPLLCGLI